ncbi:MAG: deoxyribonuclease IV [Patescibacteria group bacterium]
MLFGAHVSIAGGVFNAPLNAAAIGAEVFQFFTRSPQGGSTPPLTPDIIQLFKQNCKLSGIPNCYVHAPYIINFASANERIYHGSIRIIREELERSSLLGAKFMMAHLGSYKDLGESEGFTKVVAGLAKVLDGYTGSTKFLIEISAGAGDIIGSSFEKVAEIINHPNLKKYNIGICFDTQHAFASGYDLRTPEAVGKTFDNFDNAIGLDRLKLFHCNDSMIELSGHKDRHEHLGTGKIGLSGFKSIMNFMKNHYVDYIIETEHGKVTDDLKIMKKFRKELNENS